MRAKTVLVADDDADIRESVAEILVFAGYEVLQAKNGSEAQTLALEHTPDLVLLDHSMPGRTGLEVVDNLRQAGFDNSIILISGWDDPGNRGDSADFETLTKPFEISELMKAIENAI